MINPKLASPQGTIQRARRRPQVAILRRETQLDEFYGLSTHTDVDDNVIFFGFLGLRWEKAYVPDNEGDVCNRNDMIRAVAEIANRFGAKTTGGSERG